MTPEERIEAFHIQWIRLREARYTLARLKCYARHNEGMKKDNTKAIRAEYDAELEIDRLLKGIQS